MAKKNNRYQAPSSGGSKAWLWAGLVIAVVVAVLIYVFTVAMDKNETRGATGESGYTFTNPVSVEVADTGAVTFVAKDGASDAKKVEIFEDFRCPVCAAFEEASGDDVAKQIDDGSAAVAVNMLTFLDHNTKSDYSKRSYSAFLAVAKSGDAVATWKFHSYLLHNQPEETVNAKVFSNEELASIARDLGASDEVAEQISSGALVNEATSKAEGLSKTLADRNDGRVSSPAVFVNGESVNWQQPDWLD